ncbi:MAG: ribonuclease J [Thermomicrobiales bacterium]|nr:ribonuclease J [Thermomicrobiales bacterium]
MSDTVKLIFLGGQAEIGRNMFVLEHQDDLIVVDCGVGFPSIEHFGIDLVLPNFDYLKEHASKVRGIFITHGHEDHIGALVYLLQEVKAPLYATRFTCGLIAEKLKEADLTKEVELIEFDVDGDDVLDGGVFKLEPFRVTHSIPDCVGFGITTPAGLIVHTGDFKLDPTPPDGHLTNLDKVRSFAERGVLLLISDTTHIESEDWVPSEKTVGAAFERIFDGANGRIFVATFSSHVARMQEAVDAFLARDRKVAFVGRGMQTVSRVARELGLLTIDDEQMFEARDAIHYQDDKICFIVTGSQGELGSALNRMALGEHRDVRIEPGDTVVVSAHPIPGNEVAVFTMINELFRLGADVAYSAREVVHVSGHGSRSEIREMVRVAKPRFLLPFHGEERMLVIFEEMAITEGYDPSAITISRVGDVIEITPDAVQIVDSIPCDPVFVDGSIVGSIDDVVLRDRQTLSGDGMVTIAATVDRDSGTLIAGPEVMSRGFVYAQNSPELIEQVRERATTILREFAGNSAQDLPGVGRQIRNNVSSYLQKQTGLRPMVLPVILETAE